MLKMTISYFQFNEKCIYDLYFSTIKECNKCLSGAIYLALTSYGFIITGVTLATIKVFKFLEFSKETY